MGKYGPLRVYLSNLLPDVQDTTLTFSQIENILNTRLPASVHTYRAWWGNEAEGSHARARAWMDAEWMVDMVDLVAGWARFRRRS